jgi:hypothetical protein
MDQLNVRRAFSRTLLWAPTNAQTCLIDTFHEPGDEQSAFYPTGVGLASIGVETGAGAFGMITQATRYATIPPTIPPGTTASTAQNSRTIVESTPRYSANPPHTPAIFESVAERISRRCENNGRTRAPQYEQKFERSSSSLWHSAQFMISSSSPAPVNYPAIPLRCANFMR